MKKSILFLLVTLFPTFAFSQLKVTSDGKVAIALSDPVTAADLSVSQNDGYNYSSYSFGIRSDHWSTKTYNIGIAGRSSNDSGSNRSIGVQGVASGGQSGWKFGVIGGLSSLGNGAGIFGTTSNHVGVAIPGRYAGYFNGAVYVENDITATAFLTPSDIRLKQNVESISENTKRGGTLENVLNMNVIKYNYIDFNSLRSKSDTTTADYSDPLFDITADTHYGLSAQELERLYPDLVKKGQDGFLGINYVELVPILIRSIQELSAELDELKDASYDKQNSRSISLVDDVTSASAKLYQNTPNPFTERTEIRFSLSDDARNAYIYIFDMTGKMLRQIPVDSSMQSVTVNGYELSAGIYLYSLVVNGQEIDTKRMILSK